MNCQHCNTENGNDARFCKVCGNTLYVNNQVSSNSKFSDTFLILYLGILVFTAVLQTTIQTLVTNWYEGGARYVLGAIWILHNLSLLLIPFSIKNSTMKIIAIVITAIVILHNIYGNITFMAR